MERTQLCQQGVHNGVEPYSWCKIHPMLVGEKEAGMVSDVFAGESPKAIQRNPFLRGGLACIKTPRRPNRQPGRSR